MRGIHKMITLLYYKEIIIDNVVSRFDFNILFT